MDSIATAGIPPDSKNINIGFAGLGIMGTPMARNMVKGGTPVRKY